LWPLADLSEGWWIGVGATNRPLINRIEQDAEKLKEALIAGAEAGVQ